ncbi:armadillo-type protein [Dunaliella salina]|uniref:Armadillo-type protein n=1 Tax=Dunaliella salina TaxID=3046 RepID=A0ABQ7G9C7_DUNSA|nr:armadillo-type protein [Dunaliella salina]|eukprot:KAF5831202.1 armadillo-type protein [Dunaliella salina]
MRFCRLLNPLLKDTLAPLFTADPPKSAAEVLAAAQAKKKDGDMADGNALCGAWAALISGLKDKSADELKKELLRRAKTYAKVLRAFATSGKVELALLRYMQRLCLQAEKHLEPHFALMLHVLYDVDVLSEDAILHWYHKGSDPTGRDVFLPQTEALVKWLEEESEEEEESD